MLDDKMTSAILIMDALNRYLHPKGSFFAQKALDIIPYIEGELKYFRERGRAVFFCHTSSHIPQSEQASFDDQFVQALKPREKEKVFLLQGYNAFHLNEFDHELKKLKVDQLTIAGLYTHTNVLMTAAAAVDHGIKVVVPETCVYDANIKGQDAAFELIRTWSKGMGNV